MRKLDIVLKVLACIALAQFVVASFVTAIGVLMFLAQLGEVTSPYPTYP